MLRQTFLVLALAICVLGATLPLRRPPHSRSARGYAASRGRIYGGHDATKGQFPYMVSLQYVSASVRYHNCGGTIISTTAVLTAGHCITRNGYYLAVAGEHDLSIDEGSEQERRVAQQIGHPSYPGGDVVASYDIAVFILESALTVDTYVQTISLPTAGSIPEDESVAVVSGWGTTGIVMTPDILQTGDVKVIDHDTCHQNLGSSSYLLTDTMICSSPVNDAVSICAGDSGGPLTQNNEVIGVVSWGTGQCGMSWAQSVYSRVSASVDFITSNTDIRKTT